MTTITAPIDALLPALYAAAVVLVESVADPAVIAAAPLNHRAAALNAVSKFISRLTASAAAPRAYSASAPAFAPVPDSPAPPAAPPPVPALQDDPLFSLEDDPCESDTRPTLLLMDDEVYLGRFLDPDNDPALRLTMRVPGPLAATG